MDKDYLKFISIRKLTTLETEYTEKCNKDKQLLEKTKKEFDELNLQIMGNEFILRTINEAIKHKIDTNDIHDTEEYSQ